MLLFLLNIFKVNMRAILLFFCCVFSATLCFGQNVGIVRKNYYSTYFDSTLNVSINVFDSTSIRLGSVNPYSGAVSHLSTNSYSLTVNLTGATIDPYQNHYYIGSGFNLLTFDMNSGDLINNVPITGAFPTASFQNYRFNPSDSIIYGLVPNNFYSSYFDSISMTTIDVLDSTQIRFASLNPLTGVYTLIGNTSFNNLYTLAGNSVDPFQMVYYYSAVDTLIGIDVYSGSLLSAVPIQLPPYGIFENIAYSCADTSIYGLTRQNYTSLVYDSLYMMYLEVVDSTTFRLSKINPNTGSITFVSPINIQAGGNLTGGAYIDPNSMTYFFNNGNQIIGVSLSSGLITSSATKSYPSGEIAIDMMRSNLNCFGASKIRLDPALGIEGSLEAPQIQLFPNPAQSNFSVLTNAPIKEIEVVDFMGKVILRSSQKSMDISTLPNGIYSVHVYTQFGAVFARKLIKL